MYWNAIFKQDRIELTYKGYSKYPYDLLKEPYCKICSYPACDENTCPKKEFHPKFVKRVYAIHGYVTTSDRRQFDISDPLSKDIYFVKKNIWKAEPLGLAIAECIKGRHKELLNFDALVAVPKVDSELKVDEDDDKIRFNQADLLAKWVTSVLKIPVLNPLQKTRAQSMRYPDDSPLGPDERKEAVKDLYVCNKPYEVRNKSILLIDDVATFVYNLDKCGEELLKAGAKEVRAFVCGRTV